MGGKEKEMKTSKQKKFKWKEMKQNKAKGNGQERQIERK